MVLLLFCTQLVIARDFPVSKRRLSRPRDQYPIAYLYLDNYKPTKKYPLVVFLHRAGERGNDNESSMKHGAALFQRGEPQKYPAIVVVSRPAEDFLGKPEGGDKTRGNGHMIMQIAPKPALAAAMALVNKLIQDEGVDSSGLHYGLSMGGMGTFGSCVSLPLYLLQRYPSAVAVTTRL